MMQQPLILMKLRELWTAFNTHDWEEGKDHLGKNSNNEDDQPQHSGLIIASEDQYLAASHPYIKIRVKTQKGNVEEPEEIVVVEKDIIITSTKFEVNELKQKGISFLF